MQIDFSAAFDRVNHQGILYKHSSVGIVGSVLSVLMQFLSNRSQYVFVDGYRSELVNVVSGVPQGSVLGPLLFILYTSELFSILVNKLIGYADDSTLMAVMPSPGARVMVAESLNLDLIRVNVLCDLWGMKLNASKTKTMIVLRSRTMHPQSPPLTIDGTVLKESDNLDILGVTFDFKLTFEKHHPLRSPGEYLRSPGELTFEKSWRVFHDRLLIGRCFWGFVLTVLNTVLQCGVWLPIHALNYWTSYSVVACLTVIFPIVDLWQCCVCCTRSGVTRCTHFVALYLCLMCQSGLHAVLSSHIGILMHLPAAEPHSTVEF